MTIPGSSELHDVSGFSRFQFKWPPCTTKIINWKKNYRQLNKLNKKKLKTFQAHLTCLEFNIQNKVNIIKASLKLFPTLQINTKN